MYKTFVPKFLRKGSRADDDDDDMFRCRAPSHLPLSNYSNTIRASSAMLPPPSTADTYVNSSRSLSHHDSNLSMRKPEPAALLSTIPDESDDFAEEDPRFPRRSQIGMALSKLRTPPGEGHVGSWQDNNNPSSPYSSRTPIYPNIRNHSRNESAPSTPTTTQHHTRHHSFSRPTSRSVDHGGAPRTPRLPTHSIELSRGRSRSRSRPRAAGAGAGAAALSRDASHDSSSSRVPISRFNNLTGGAGGSGIGRSSSRTGMAGGGGPDLIDDAASSAGVSMTTIWSDAPRRGSKHSRI